MIDSTLASPLLQSEVDDSPRLGLGNAAYPPHDTFPERYTLLECNPATDRMEVIGAFHMMADAISCYSQAAWEADQVGGLRLQILNRHKVAANGHYMQVVGEQFPMLVWITCTGEVFKYVRRVNPVGETYAQLVW